VASIRRGHSAASTTPDETDELGDGEHHCDQCATAMGTLGRDLPNTLYYGDNLEILQRFLSDESVDLIYLDPPFSRNAAYNAIFRDESGQTSDAQMRTFEESWHWGPTAARHFDFLTCSGLNGGRVPNALTELTSTFRAALQPSPMLAYLVEMATRLVELHRVLRPSGSMYLHCDPVASHHLKLVVDAIIGAESFRNEIIWRRTSAHGNASRRYGSVHDVILFYTKGSAWTWNQQFAPYTPAYVDSRFSYSDPDGRRYRTVDLRNPSPRPNLAYTYRGYAPHPNGWLVSLETMERLDAEGRLYFPPKGQTGRIRRKLYLDESLGVPVTDVWNDIEPINARARERLGYPTQKPLALLQRIIATSSNEGDVVLDPFCGCGTAIEAAESLGRSWIGIDRSVEARNIIIERMAARGTTIDVFDWPTEVAGARAMAERKPDGRHDFEAWALARLNAQSGRSNGAKGSDRGIDGRIRFRGEAGRVETILVSVKSGHVSASMVRDLIGTMQREKAAMGLLFTLAEPTTAMLREANSAGFYRSAADGEAYPRVVIFTARELLDEGRQPVLPARSSGQEEFWPLPTISPTVRRGRPASALKRTVSAERQAAESASNIRTQLANLNPDPPVLEPGSVAPSGARTPSSRRPLQ
jgi:site-specific DNA-methyltransferase (adenine-specific)